MTLDEARELVNGPLWPKVRDAFIAYGKFEIYPKGDLRRLDYLDREMREQIAAWQQAIPKIAEWRKVIDGAAVRQLKAENPGVYPEILRYALYLEGREDATRTLLKIKFPEAYALCCS